MAKSGVIRLADVREDVDRLARDLVNAAVRLEDLARMLDREWKRCELLRRRFEAVVRDRRRGGTRVD